MKPYAIIIIKPYASRVWACGIYKTRCQIVVPDTEWCAYCTPRPTRGDAGLNPEPKDTSPRCFTKWKSSGSSPVMETLPAFWLHSRRNEVHEGAAVSTPFSAENMVLGSPQRWLCTSYSLSYRVFQHPENKEWSAESGHK